MKKGSSIKWKQNIMHASLAACLVMLLFLCVLFIEKIYPFGDNTFLMYDMKREYVDYYSYLKSVYQGKNNILYSFSTTLGSSPIGLYIFYISSPFFLLFAFLPNTLFPLGITIVAGLKLMTAAFLMDLYLLHVLEIQGRNFTSRTDDGVKLLKRENENPSWMYEFFSPIYISAFLGAVSFAMSSYLFSHSMNSMWIDAVMLLPITLWMLERLLTTGRKLAYVFCVALMLWVNYYITYMALIFIGFWTLLWLWEQKCTLKQWGKKIRQVAIATVWGACLDAVVLLPTAIGLMDSPKDITQFGLEAAGKNITPLQVFSKLSVLSYDRIQPRFGLPQVYAGIFLLLLTGFYFVNRTIAKRERIGKGILFAILLVSFCLDYCNLAWHAFMEPSGHPYRQAYLWIFLVIYCGTKGLFSLLQGASESVSNESKEIQKNGYLSVISKSGKIWFISSLVMGAVLAVGLRPAYENISGNTIVVTAICWLVYTLIGVWITGIYKNNKMLLKLDIEKESSSDYMQKTIPESKDIGEQRKYSLGIVFCLLVLLVSAELIANCAYTYHFQALQNQPNSQYVQTLKTMQPAVELVKKTGNGFYRMENLNPRQQNDALQYDYNGITYYSSAGKMAPRYFLQHLGFTEDGLLTHYGHDNTVTADAILNVKYVLSDGTYPVHNSYTELETVKAESQTDAPQMSDQASMMVETAKAYENPYALSLAMTASKFVNKPDLPEKLDPFSLQEQWIEDLLGESVQIFKPASLQDISEKFADQFEKNYTVTVEQTGEVYLYLQGILGKSQGIAIYKDGEFLSPYGNLACLQILNLGYYELGDSFTISLACDTDPADYGELLVVTEDIEALEKCHEALSAAQTKVEKLSSSRLAIETGSGEALVTTIPYEKGWTIWVDGEKVQPEVYYGTFMTIPINNIGKSHFVEMSYIPPGMKMGVWISAVSILLFLGAAYVTKLGQK